MSDTRIKIGDMSYDIAEIVAKCKGINENSCIVDGTVVSINDVHYTFVGFHLNNKHYFVPVSKQFRRWCDPIRSSALTFKTFVENYCRGEAGVNLVKT